jgi:hypothetical protein
MLPSDETILPFPLPELCLAQLAQQLVENSTARSASDIAIFSKETEILRKAVQDALPALPILCRGKANERIDLLCILETDARDDQHLAIDKTGNLYWNNGMVTPEELVRARGHGIGEAVKQRLISKIRSAMPASR